jgi:trans-L-3-hydroxyproline dehydratase
MFRKLKNLRWAPSAEWMKISTIDMHTGGEPLRILVNGYPVIEGKTILEKRNYFRNNLDYIRRGIILEPRGHVRKMAISGPSFFTMRATVPCVVMRLLL